ncbi:MAG: hypothetical protein A2V70_03780 [Planctomycetes bacterium RBG_13_63_9]|nr:MAG: hypothetical protein A2V70_03780 [Planctomycetes bacterium RBG_13_63_9]
MKQRRRRIRLVDTYDEQLLLWLQGKNVHLRSSRRGESFSCCPDFSCCQPSLAQPIAVRRAFVNKPNERDGMLMRFLGRLVESAVPSNRVFITDGKTRIVTHGRART